MEDAVADGVEQALVDLDALIISSQVTTRCVFHDRATDYLQPLADAAVRVRIGELETALAPRVTDLADRISVMREEANAIACGHEGLEPFLGFARQVAADVIAIAMQAWAEIDIDRCSYFADDDFLAAVARARSQARTAATEDEADPSRRAYIEEVAEAWIALFNGNCHNLGFDPTLTLPGQIALAIPMQDI